MYGVDSEKEEPADAMSVDTEIVTTRFFCISPECNKHFKWEESTKGKVKFSRFIDNEDKVIIPTKEKGAPDTLDRKEAGIGFEEEEQ